MVLLFVGPNYSQINSVKIINEISQCNCWQQRDSSWSIAAFDNVGGDGFPGLPPEYRNDDWSTVAIMIPFTFCFYGDPVTKIFINNNGNVSIGKPITRFLGELLSSNLNNIIAPFWADVDTRGLNSGLVYYKITSTHMIVEWDKVGYFGVHDDKLNTFQLIISDGSDPIIASGQNVSFCYKDMQWTTGDASEGISGFGGVPAEVGVSHADSINYISIGLFDDSTYNYDGPYGLNDGIQSLNNQSFSFNVCINNFNIPPILRGSFICDTVELCLGDSFKYETNFISPELNQITSVSVNNSGLAGLNVNTIPGNQAIVSLSYIADTIGLFTIDIVGTDDGSPPQTSTYSLVINIDNNCNVNILQNNLDKKIILPTTIHENLTINSLVEINTIRIFNSLGLLIYFNNNSSNLNIDATQWGNGIYFILLQSNDKIYMRKILKY